MKKLRLLAFILLSLGITPTLFASGEVKFIYYVVKYSGKAIYKISDFYDGYDVGYHQYITNKETIVNKDVDQTESGKTAIGVFQENMSGSSDAEDSYIVKSSISAESTSGEDSAYGYYHADSGSASSSKSGGIYDCTIWAGSNGEYAIGIATEEGTSFVGATYDGTTVNVNDNSITAHGYDDATAYGIYAQGDWYVYTYDNSFFIYAENGSAVGVHIDTDVFYGLSDNDYYIKTELGSAYAISVKLTDDYNLNMDYIKGEDIEINVTDSGDSGYAVGIFLGAEEGVDASITVDEISDIEIDISTQGDIGLGIGIDDINANTYVDTISDISMNIDVERGVAVGIHIDTLSSGYAVGSIDTIGVSLKAHGNVYGYVLGKNISPTSESDGGIAFYNSYYMDSTNMAEYFEYESISIHIESYGTSSNYDGNSAYGIYIQDTTLTDSINFSGITVSAAGTPYAMYLDNSRIESTLDIAFKSTTYSLTGYGIYLENDSYIKELAGTIYLEATTDFENTAEESLTAVYLKNSTIDTITSTITFYNTAEKLHAVSIDNDSTVGLFDGTVKFSSWTGELQSDVYVFLLGATPGEFDTVLFYNRDTQNSNGFTFGENALADLTNARVDSNYIVYGFYITGSDYNIETSLSIYDAKNSIYLNDSATLTLNGSEVTGMYNYIYGQSTLNVINNSNIDRVNSGTNFTTVDDNSTLNIEDSTVTSIITLTNSSTLTLKNVQFYEINYTAPSEINIESGSSVTFSGDNTLESTLSVSGENSYAEITDGSNTLYSIEVEDNATLYINANTNTTLTNRDNTLDFAIYINNANYVQLSGNIEFTNIFEYAQYGIYVEDTTLINFTSNASVTSTSIDYDTDDTYMSYVLSNNSTDLNIKGDDSTISLSGNIEVNNGSFNIIDGNFQFTSQTWVVNGDIHLGSKDDTTGIVTTSTIEFTQSTCIDTNSFVIYANSIDDTSIISVADGVNLTFSEDFILTFILSDEFTAQIGETLLISDSIVLSSITIDNISIYIDDELLDESIWEIYNEDDTGFGITFIDAIPTTAVPEPSTYAMIFGALAFGFAFYRKPQK